MARPTLIDETPRTPSPRNPEHVSATILAMAADRGPDKTLCPSEVARALGGSSPDEWSPLMPIVRREAVRLTKAGRIVILRKGRAVDPDDFKGIYRIRTAELTDESASPPTLDGADREPE